MQSITQHVERVRSGNATVADITAESLDRVTAPDAREAWSAVDAGGAMRQAREIDAALRDKNALLPLAGVTVGVKDLFAVTGLPMRAGSHLTGNAPAAADAGLVARLRRAGAVIIGTTSMPEFALGVTVGARNPHNPLHTPGSSSTGCAVAVAAGHVSLALAMQTNASIIRPASFCGVAAFKPSQGKLSINGAMRLAPSLDQPGFMAADLEGLAITHAAFFPDEAALSSGGLPFGFLSGKYAFVRTPAWNKADEHSRRKIEALAACLNAEEILLPEEFDRAWIWLDCLMERELADNLAWLRGREGELAPPLRAALARGRGHSAASLAAARDGRKALCEWSLEALSLFDCVLTPAATGPAPRLEDGTGSPAFSTLWNLMGAPCLCLPAFSENGLPVGVQLVGAPGRDRALLGGAALIVEIIRKQAVDYFLRLGTSGTPVTRASFGAGKRQTTAATQGEDEMTQTFDLVFENVTLLSAAPADPAFRTCTVGVTGNRISFIGGKLPEDAICKRRVNGVNKVLTPGFTNVHLHSGLVMVRGVAADLGFAPSYTPGIPKGTALTPDQARVLGRLAGLETMLLGSTLVGEHFVHADVVTEAMAELGLRLAPSWRIHDVDFSKVASGVWEHNPAIGEKNLKGALELAAKWEKHPRVTPQLAAHAVDTCSDEFLIAIAEESARTGMHVNTHLSQSKVEEERVFARTGKTSTEVLEDVGLLNERLMGGHCIYVTDSDIQRMARAGAHCVHIPKCNAASGRMAPIHKIKEAGINIAFATDTQNGDMVELMRWALSTARVQLGGVSDAWQPGHVFSMATLGGAAACGLDKEIGTVEVGKLADLTLFDFDRPHLVPAVNPLGVLVHTGQGRDVDMVVIDGEVLVEGGLPVKVDMREVCDEARRVCGHLWANA